MSEKSPVVFLDRDGVLTKEKSYIRNKQELEIFSYSSEAVELIHKAGYMAIVITNQSGIARGIIKENDLLEMNDYLKKETGVDDLYYCPHYPPIGAEKLPYQIICQCRKPKDGLMLKAAKDHQLDLNKSYFVGDRASDILAGQAIGATTVLLESGYGSTRLEANVKPDMIFNNLMEFAVYLYEEKK